MTLFNSYFDCFYSTCHVQYFSFRVSLAIRNSILKFNYNLANGKVLLMVSLPTYHEIILKWPNTFHFNLLAYTI